MKRLILRTLMLLPALAAGLCVFAYADVAAPGLLTGSLLWVFLIAAALVVIAAVAVGRALKKARRDKDRDRKD